jgi:hypothetical protein
MKRAYLNRAEPRCAVRERSGQRLKPQPLAVFSDPLGQGQQPESGCGRPGHERAAQVGSVESSHRLHGERPGRSTGPARRSPSQALLDPSSGLLSERSRQALFSENFFQGGARSGIALSWFRGGLDGHVYYAHAGRGGGYYAEIRIYPQLGRGSVVLFNRTGFSDNAGRTEQPRLNGADPTKRPKPAPLLRSGGPGIRTPMGLRPAVFKSIPLIPLVSRGVHFFASDQTFPQSRVRRRPRGRPLFRGLSVTKR